MVNFSLRDPQKSFVFRYVKMCFMVAQTACLDQSSQDMEHSCGNDENRACRGPLQQNVRSPNGAISWVYWMLGMHSFIWSMHTAYAGGRCQRGCPYLLRLREKFPFHNGSNLRRPAIRERALAIPEKYRRTPDKKVS